jgi:hypothetical protein
MEEVTPAHLRCTPELGCPSVHRLPDGRLLIVGETAGPNGEEIAVRAYQALARKEAIGSDETAIIIHPDLLSTVMQEEIEKAVLAERKKFSALMGPIDYNAIRNEIDGNLGQPQSRSVVKGHLKSSSKGLPLEDSEIEKAVKAERERCAVLAWSVGMAAHSPGADCRELGSKIAAAIRSTPSQGEEG